jgi:transcriptional regulator with XRE-family HTH domain
MVDQGRHELVTHLMTKRKERGISLAEVARRMGASTMTVRRIESGEVTPTIEAIERYASAVGSTVSWELDDLADEVAEDLQVGASVDVDWGLDDAMPGRVIGVHGSPNRIWLQVELSDGPTVDVPMDAVRPRRRTTRRS